MSASAREDQERPGSNNTSSSDRSRDPEALGFAGIANLLFALVFRRLGLVAAIALLGTAGAILGLGDAIIIARIVDNLGEQRSWSFHLFLIGLLVGLLLLRNLIGLLENAVSLCLQSILTLELRGKYLGSILTRPSADDAANRAGSLVHIESASLTTVQDHMTDALSDMVRSVFLLLVALTLLFTLSPFMGLALVILGVAWFALSMIFFPMFERHMRAMHDTTADSRSLFLDSVRNAELVRLMRLTGRTVQRYLGQLVSESIVAGRFLRFNIIHNQFTALLPTVLFLTAFLYGGALAIAGQVSVGEVIAFNIIASRCVGPINRIVEYALSLPGLKVAAQRAFNHLDPDYDLAPAVRPDSAVAAGAVLTARDISCVIKDRPVFAGVSLTVEPGTLTLVHGPSGAGKTTLLRCLSGQLAPSAGTITYAGMPVADLPAGVIQLTPADPMFFRLTLMENLRLADVGETLPARFDACLDAAGCRPIVDELPDGLDTQLEEDLSPLSRGQLQRFALARSLLMSPRILLLDEALNGVEADLERQIVRQVRTLFSGIAIVCATHRNTLTDFADQQISISPIGMTE